MNKILKLYRIWFAKTRLSILRLWGVDYVRAADGPRMVANWDDATFWFCAASMYDQYYKKFLKSLKAPFVFIDVGANQGFFSFLAAKNSYARELHCFEPIPATYELLDQNAKLNGCINAQLHNLAIAEKTGASSIFVQPGHSGAASMRDSSLPPTSHSINIETVDYSFLSGLVRSVGLPIHIKIDVEGFELEVMNQLVKTDWFSRVESIFYEVDELWVSPVEIELLLRDWGFTDFIKSGLNHNHYDVHAMRGPLDKR